MSHIKIFDPFRLFFLGQRQGSDFIFLQVSFEVSQHNLLKRLSFLKSACFSSLSKTMWLLLHEFNSGPSVLFYSIDLHVCFLCHAVLSVWLCGIAWSQVKGYFQHGSCYYGLFWKTQVFGVTIWILDFLFYYYEELYGILVGATLRL